MTLLLPLGAELLGWLLGAPNRTESFAWFRVQAHLGPGGAALALLAGLAALLLPARRLPPAWVGALLVHAAFLDVAQNQPDAATWFTLSQHVARDPIGALLGWSDVAWSGPEARFHAPYPLVPLVVGLAFRLLGECTGVLDGVLAAMAVALPAAVEWAARAGGPPGPVTARAARLAGWCVVGLPLLQAQSGWLLADLPLCLALAVAWGALLRARGPGGVLLAALAALPAVATKVSGLGYALLPALAVLLPLRWTAALLLGGAALLVGVDPPRVRSLDTYGAAALGLALHLRAAAWLVVLGRAPAALRRGWRARGLSGALSGARRDRLDRLVLGVLAAVPAVVLWSPVEHVPRYALPAGVALAIGVAAAAPAVARFLAASGLVLLLLGYRPVVAYSQGINLQEATRRLEAEGVTAIEVVVDAPGTTFPPAAVAALVDLYASVPVRTGDALALAPPGRKRHWWEFVVPPPWRASGEADGVLLCLYAADATRFETARPGSTRIATVSRYRASSLLLPREVVLYRKSR